MNFDTSVLQVAIEDIIPNRFQPRLSFEDEGLNELAASIKQHGIIQPLVLRKNGEKYEIVAGERRYKAAMLAGLSSVPAVIAKIDDKKSAEVAVVENIQRRELTAIEEAKSYKALLDQGYMSEDQLARKLGISLSLLQSKLKLLTLCQEVQDAVLENRISERHARSLLIISDQDQQRQLLNKIMTERLTVRQLDEIIRNNKGDQKMNSNVEQEITPKTESVIPTLTPIIENNSIELGPIDLGIQTSPGKFGDLEAESVNMTFDEVDPLNMTTNINSQISTPEVKSSNVENSMITNSIDAEFVDSLDTLDFSPNSNNQNITIVKDKINTLVNELKSLNINVLLNEKQENGKTILSLEIDN